MYGDTDQIRRLATSMESRAEALDALVADLVGATEACVWEGVTADAMRDRVGVGTARLSSCADQHRAAAGSLRRHADSVDEAKELIARLEQRTRGLIGAAVARLDGVDVLPGDLRLARFVPPPPGHADWLRIDLPGIAA